MKKLIKLLFLLGFVLLSCNNPFKSDLDILPPEVSITSHQPNSQYTVSQVIQVSCVATDRNGIDKTQLWLNGSYLEGAEDKIEPYKFYWNTSERKENGDHIYVDNEEFILHIRAWDKAGNKKDSDPIYMTVDNSISIPDVPQIISVNYSAGYNQITWIKNTETDFREYVLEKSNFSSFSVPLLILNTSDQNQTNFNDFDINPFMLEYYRITVYDTLNYFSTSDIVVSSMENNPSPVDIISITYTLEEMIVEWQPSSIDDFLSYTLFKSESMNGPFITSAVYFDQNINSHAISQFDPTIENWFMVSVSDTFMLSDTGNVATNLIDAPPAPTFIYGHEMNINQQDNGVDTAFIALFWNISTEDDVIGYEITIEEKDTIVYGISANSLITSSPNLADPKDINISTIDYWNQKTINENPYTVYNNYPQQSIIEDISFNADSITIKWSESQEEEQDFKRYILYHRNDSNFTGTNQDILGIYYNSSTTDTTFETPDFNLDWFYWIEVQDYWNKTALSPFKWIFEEQDYYLPEPVTLYTPHFQSGAGDGAFTLQWSTSNNPEFKNYTVFVADNIGMEGALIAQYTTGGDAVIVQSQLTTSGILPELDQYDSAYYQVFIQDEYDMSAGSNVVRYYETNFEWVSIPAGEFLYGEFSEAQIIEEDYDAMKYEVNNVQFVEFLREYQFQLQDDGNDCIFDYIIGIYEADGELYHFISLQKSKISYIESLDNFGNCIGNGDFTIETGYEDHPVSGVTWYGANTFSELYDFRLPTDFEWEKAARGNWDIDYPWGHNSNDILTEEYANFWQFDSPNGNETKPIGYYNGNNNTYDSYSPFGLYDMTGNIREWTDTFQYDENNNILNISRGGHFLISGNSNLLKVWGKELLHPLIDSQNPGSVDTGFRCVK